MAFPASGRSTTSPTLISSQHNQPVHQPRKPSSTSTATTSIREPISSELFSKSELLKSVLPRQQTRLAHLTKPSPFQRRLSSYLTVVATVESPCLGHLCGSLVAPDFPIDLYAPDLTTAVLAADNMSSNIAGTVTSFYLLSQIFLSTIDAQL